MFCVSIIPLLLLLPPNLFVIIEMTHKYGSFAGEFAGE